MGQGQIGTVNTKVGETETREKDEYPEKRVLSLNENDLLTLVIPMNFILNVVSKCQ